MFTYFGSVGDFDRAFFLIGVTLAPRSNDFMDRSLLMTLCVNMTWLLEPWKSRRALFRSIFSTSVLVY